MAENPFPGGTIGSGKGQAKGAAKPKADKTTKATAKAPAKAKAPKAEGEKIVRSPSTISKEGTAVDAFDGVEYPVTQFPTIRQKDGTYVRGTVTRKNLPAWRAQRKAEREAAKAAKDAAKAEKAKAKAAADKEAKSA